MTVRTAEVRDLAVVAYHLGKVLMGLSSMMAAPAVLALVLGEWNAATALLSGAALCFAVGALAAWRLRTSRPLTVAQGAVVVAAAWLFGSVLAAVPFLLSGHTGGMLDAWFEAMSGLTTSGLSVLQDLDHLAYSLQVYRHLTHFVGGQGVVIVVLALLARGGSVASLYAAEGRDERLVPSVLRTARYIYLIATVYLVVGTTALTLAMWTAGVRGWRAVWHALTIFLAAFDTGGFSPTSASIGYYRSASVEAVVVVLMLAGTFSFALHHQLWQRRYGELHRNTELRTLAVTLLGLLGLLFYGLVSAEVFASPAPLLRQGAFTLVSAHTGTGFSVTSGAQVGADWGVLAPAAIVIAMAFGGMSGSTAGGVKAIRLALTTKGLTQDVRRLVRPEAALDVATYHSGKDHVLRPILLRSATAILFLYVMTYLLGGLIGLLHGEWSISETVFESVSATANVGLSVGIVAPEMPASLQVLYAIQMWLGRLEFMAVFAFFATLASTVRGRT
jgi:trk system potassium uptake protein TrkH